MSYFRKKLERRTFSQDRYYILIKRQREGRATFNELTELDEIVNRVPDIRDLVIRENFGQDSDDIDNPDDSANSNKILSRSLQHPSLWERLKNWARHIFITPVSIKKEQGVAILF